MLTKQIYDPAANAWSLGAPMPYAGGSCATALIGGKIYIAGGITGATSTNGAAMYDPISNTWVNLAPIPQGQQYSGQGYNHAAANTDSTKFYIFGGRSGGNGSGNGYNEVLIYDPGSNTWISSDDPRPPGSLLSPLPQARGGMGKAVYYKGDFFVMGGETYTGSNATPNNVYNRVDIYNVASNVWRLGTPMPTARHGIFPVLQGSRIYVPAGAVKASTSSSTVFEIYILP